MAPPSRESSRIPRLPRFACAALHFVSSFPLRYKDERSPTARKNDIPSVPGHFARTSVSAIASKF
jgi:hypothetical protein